MKSDGFESLAPHWARPDLHLSKALRRVAVLACAVALPLALASGARADTVTTTITQIDTTITDRTCEFPLSEHIEGQRVEVKHYNDAGELISWTRHVPLIATITNPVNGVTATGHQAFNPEADLSSSVFRAESFAGLRFILTVPQLGVVLLDAGTLQFDETGGIAWSAGPHQLLAGDVDAYCAYFFSTP